MINIDDIKILIKNENRLDNEDEILTTLIEMYTNIALQQSNRDNTEQNIYILTPIIQTAVVKAYHRLGQEGVSNFSINGISETYDDIIKSMFDSIIRGNLRLLKL